MEHHQLAVFIQGRLKTIVIGLDACRADAYPGRLQCIGSMSEENEHDDEHDRGDHLDLSLHGFPPESAEYKANY